MSKFYINVGSVTHAMKGRDTLISYGYRAFARRNPSPKRRVGCGYSIYVDRDVERAVEILQLSNVEVSSYGSIGDYL